MSNRFAFGSPARRATGLRGVARSYPVGLLTPRLLAGAGNAFTAATAFADLTTGKTASANTVLVAAAGAIDDVIAIAGANYWQGSAVSGVNARWWVDLVTPFEVKRFRVWNDTGGGFITGFRIEYSATGAWGGEEGTAFTGTMAQGTGTGANDCQAFSWAGVGAHRYWSLFATGCNDGRANNPLVIELELSL